MPSPIATDVFHGERLRGTQIVPIRRIDAFRVQALYPSERPDPYFDIKKPVFSPTTAAIKSHILTLRRFKSDVNQPSALLENDSQSS
ncbi:hypothetical protein [Pseudomonas bohemica]|uniref:hypothetical protein n=1 Tax=Pseudomonas bohemica TaxID=2044872 RepID=UPI0018FE1577|nr:hypothetical protein [Pseudomonas bohemica]